MGLVENLARQRAQAKGYDPDQVVTLAQAGKTATKTRWEWMAEFVEADIAAMCAASPVLDAAFAKVLG
jgi:hypothetical protein